jgi:hypothetical protein
VNACDDLAPFRGESLGTLPEALNIDGTTIGGTEASHGSLFYELKDSNFGFEGRALHLQHHAPYIYMTVNPVSDG